MKKKVNSGNKTPSPPRQAGNERSSLSAGPNAGSIVISLPTIIPGTGLSCKVRL